MIEFVPIYEFAKIKGIQVQNIYRYIREGKIKPEDFKWEEKIVKRLRIRKDLEF